MHQTTPVRILLTLIVAVPLLLTACGSSQARTLKIGVVYALIALDPLVEGFKVGMTEQGYVEGKDVTYLYDKPTSASSAASPPHSAKRP